MIKKQEQLLLSLPLTASANNTLTNRRSFTIHPFTIPPLSLFDGTSQPKQASQNTLHPLPEVRHLHSCRHTIFCRARLYDHGTIRRSVNESVINETFAIWFSSFRLCFQCRYSRAVNSRLCRQVRP